MSESKSDSITRSRIRKRDSDRRFASPHLRMLEDVLESLVCEPHLQPLKVAEKPHGVVRDMLNAEPERVNVSGEIQL